MAASVLCSGSALNPSLAGPSVGLPKSSFLSGSTHKRLLAPPSWVARSRRDPLWRFIRSGYRGFSDDIPKQFRGENLKEGVIENFKNVPPAVYGLIESQMEMDMVKKGNSPLFRQKKKVKEETLTASWSYSNATGSRKFAEMCAEGVDVYSMSTMCSGGAYSMCDGPPPGEHGDTSDNPPPDLPSYLLDCRVVYLGLPIFPAVTELIVAELMYLDYRSRKKPIYMYINSTGTQDINGQIVGSENDAFAIADAIMLAKAPVYTMNMGMAFGQAAMLLALGTKGHRGILPHSAARLHLPSIYNSSGTATDMWVQSNELQSDSNAYLELLSVGIGKSKDELFKDLQVPKQLVGEKMIEYGVADRIPKIHGRRG